MGTHHHAHVGGPEEPLSPVCGQRPVCHLRHWEHVPLADLNILSGRVKFAARYSFPVHQHSGMTYVVIPPSRMMSLALKDYAKKDYRFYEPRSDESLLDQLRHNMVSFQASGLRELGRPVDVPFLVDALLHPHPPPLPTITPAHPPHEDILAAEGVPIVGTSTGWRPLVGSFRHFISNWQRFRSLMKPMVPAIITTGAWLVWEEQPPPPLWLANRHMSASHHAFVSAEVQDLRRTGAVDVYDIHEMGLPRFVGGLSVDEDDNGKMRLIYDPRYINAYLQVPPIKFEHLRSLALLVERCCYMLKTDLKSGYHHIVLQRKFAPFLCFLWEGTVYFWVGLVFGLASAPYIFESVMIAFRNILRRVFEYKLLSFLDDSNFCLPDHPDVHITIVIRDLLAGHASCEAVILLHRLLQFGGVYNTKKIQGGREVEMLGTMVNSQVMRLSIPQRRWLKLQSHLKRVVCHHRQQVRTLSRIAGSLVSMQDGLRFAKVFLWAMHYFIMPFAIAAAWSRRVTVPPIIIHRCEWWLNNFHTLNGVDIHRPPAVAVQVDAAQAGSGGTVTGPGFCIFAHHDRPACQKHLHNNVWELLAFVEVIVATVLYLEHRRIVLKGDNVFALSYFRRGGGKDPYCTALMQWTWEYLLERDIEVVKLEHVPGPRNVVPDGLSRWVDFRGDWRLKESVWQEVRSWIIREGLPHPTLDCFASSMNHLLPHFVTRWHEIGSTFTDFMTADIDPKQWVFWINPPFAMMESVLLHLRATGCIAYVVAPCKPNHTPMWWSSLREATVAVLRLPKDAFTSVVTGHERGFHAVPYDINVHFVYLPPP